MFVERYQFLTFLSFMESSILLDENSVDGFSIHFKEWYSLLTGTSFQ